MKPQERKSGFTLLEVTIAARIAVILFLSIGTLTQTATLAMDQLARSQQIDRDIQRSFREIIGNLKASAAGGIVIDSTDPDFDVLTLQVPDPDDNGDPIVYGYVDPDGVFQAGWSAQYRVDTSSLVRRTLNNVGATVGPDEIFCSRVDTAFDSGQGPEKGFQVTQNGPLVEVLLRVRAPLRDDSDLLRQERTAIRPVNP